MDELRKVLDECLKLIEYIRNIINNQYVSARTLTGQPLYGQNQPPNPMNKLVAKLYELTPLVKPFNENLSKRIKYVTESLSESNQINPYQFGGIINLLGFLNLELETSNSVSLFLQSTKGVSKIFISHSTEDVKYISAFVNLLEKIGVKEGQLFCSSIEGYEIPMSYDDEDDIYKYLKEQFQNHDLYVIFMLSENYYKSPVCLNEMGAAWVLQNGYQSVLLPNFDFPQVKGVVNPRKISFKLDDKSQRTYKLSELKDNICKKLCIKSGSHTLWERQRNEFLDEIDSISDKT